MRRSNTALYSHVIWSTWDRLPLLAGARRAAAYNSIVADCRARKVEVLAIGGIEDHVHLLICAPATVALSTLVNQMKGASSHLINRRFPGGDFFKWQGSYWARSVSFEHTPRVRNYIQRQEEHHGSGTTDPALEDDEAA